MAPATIPVDLFNPGQVFACLGFLEAADVLLGDAEGGFDWTDEANTRFLLKANGDADPVESVLGLMSTATIHSFVSEGSDLSTDKWNVGTRIHPIDVPFPFPLPSSPATLPAVLEGTTDGSGRKQILLTHWGEDRSRTSRDNVKFWAGAAGYPGAALARDALALVREQCLAFKSKPFDLAASQSSSFRFDWRRDYIPIDIGFSLNNHSGNRFVTTGYPLVELLAAIGLTNARPEPLSKLEYRYSAIGLRSPNRLLDASLHRASLGGSRLPFPQRFFRMRLGWPGKENQARCITTVTEEMNP